MAWITAPFPGGKAASSAPRRSARAGSRRERAGADYAGLVRKALAQVRARQLDFAVERAEAAGLYERLLDQPSGRRHLILRNSRSAATWALADLLVEGSRGRLGCDAPLAVELARLATLVAHSLPTERYGTSLFHDINARAWAAVGNAERIAGDLERSRVAFARGRRHLLQGSSEALERGLFYDLETSLLATLGSHADAEAAIDRAASLFRLVGDLQLSGCAEIKKGTLFALQGRLDEAVTLLERGLSAMDAERHPRVVTLGRAVLGRVEVYRGRPLQAQAALCIARRTVVGQDGCEIEVERLEDLLERAERESAAALSGRLSAWPVLL